MCATVVVLSIVPHVIADTLTLRGSTIPLRNVTVQAIRDGEVFYLDHNDRQARRSLDDVSRLGFEGLSQLDQAEQELSDGDRDAALRWLLQSLLVAETPVQRLWIHVRLSRVHDYRDEYVPAAGHAAAAMMIQQDSYWRILEPTSQPTEPSYTQAVEADDLLREAARQVTNGTLQQTIVKMHEIVRPIRLRLADEYNGPPIAQGSTWSGFPKKQIEAATFVTAGDEGAEPRTGTAAPQLDADSDTEPETATPAPIDTEGTSEPPAPPTRPASGPARVVDSEAADRAADAIDNLLEAGEFASALNQCEAAGTNAGERDVARLLHQWGRALVGVGRPRDAAIRFTQCAVLFRGTQYGLESLIVTAELYRDEFRKPETSRRLARRALELAEIQGRKPAADRARALLRTAGGGR